MVQLHEDPEGQELIKLKKLYKQPKCQEREQMK